MNKNLIKGTLLGLGVVGVMFTSSTSAYSTVTGGMDGEIPTLTVCGTEYVSSNEGANGCITIMDRNLGATSNDITSSDSYGDYYQWGDNTPRTEANWLTDYSPDDNAWGGGSDGESLVYPVENESERRGPCPENYHVPSAGELSALMDMWAGSNVGGYLGDIEQFIIDFQIPIAGWRHPSNGRMNNLGYVELWSSTYSYDDYASDFWRCPDGDGGVGSESCSYGLPVRCFKDSALGSSSSDEYIVQIEETMTTTIGETVQQGLPTPTITTNTVNEVAGDSVLGEVNVDFGTSANVIFSHPVQVNIPVNGPSQVIVKVKHGGDSMYGFAGLTTNSSGSCSNGVPTSNQYNGETINVVDGYATIYSCAASSFIALGIGSGESLGSTGQVTLTLTEGNNTCIVHDYNLGTQSVSSLATHVASEAQEIACEFLKDTGVIVSMTMSNLRDGEKTIGAGNFTGIIAPGGFFGSIQALLNRSFNLSGMTLIYEKSGNAIGLWTGTLQIDGTIPEGTPSGSYTGTLEIVIQPKL